MLTSCHPLSPWTEIFQIWYGQTRSGSFTCHSHVPSHSKHHLLFISSVSGIRCNIPILMTERLLRKVGDVDTESGKSQEEFSCFLNVIWGLRDDHPKVSMRLNVLIAWKAWSNDCFRQMTYKQSAQLLNFPKARIQLVILKKNPRTKVTKRF